MANLTYDNRDMNEMEHCLREEVTALRAECRRLNKALNQINEWSTIGKPAETILRDIQVFAVMSTLPKDHIEDTNS